MNKKITKCSKIIICIKHDRITMIPGVEPILLDLENLFLLSVSLENYIFPGKKAKTKLDNIRNLLYINLATADRSEWVASGALG